MLFSSTNIDKTYSYEDFLMRNRMKYYVLVPVAVLMAIVVYLFFIYAPGSSTNTNDGSSATRAVLKQSDSLEIGATTVTDAALAEEIASMESMVFTVDEATTEETAEEAAEEAAEETTEETTEETALAVDNSAQAPITSAAVDGNIEVAITAAPAAEEIEESIGDASTEDITVKRVTYVSTDSFDAPKSDDSSANDSKETATPQVEKMQSQSVVTDDQKQPSGRYIEHQAVITSSLSQATSDAGLSTNQTARIRKIFAPYLDSRRELRKGDRLTILLDPEAGTTGNDAEQLHRLEFHGYRKNLVAIRKEGSLSDYEVRDADGKLLGGKAPAASGAVAPGPVASVEPAPVVEKSPRAMSVKPAPHSTADNADSKGGMNRMQAVVTISLFSAAREAGLNVGQTKKLEEILTPYINFNKEVRKGDHLVVTLKGGEIYSSEFNGAVKKLTVARVADGAYRVKLGETGSDTLDSDDAGSAKRSYWEKLGFGFSGGDEKIDGKVDEKIDEKADENSSAKKPFWKRFGFGSSTEVSAE